MPAQGFFSGLLWVSLNAALKPHSGLLAGGFLLSWCFAGVGWLVGLVGMTATFNRGLVDLWSNDVGFMHVLLETKCVINNPSKKLRKCPCMFTRFCVTFSCLGPTWSVAA